MSLQRDFGSGVVSVVCAGQAPGHKALRTAECAVGPEGERNIGLVSKVSFPP